MMKNLVSFQREIWYKEIQETIRKVIFRYLNGRKDFKQLLLMVVQRCQFFKTTNVLQRRFKNYKDMIQ